MSLDYGAQLAQNIRSPLHLAVGAPKDDTRVLQLILNHEPRININRWGKKSSNHCVDVAIRHNNVKCFELLLEQPDLRLDQGDHIMTAWEMNASGFISQLIADGRPIGGLSAQYDEEAREKCRWTCDWYSKRAAKVFSAVIFLCDGLVTVKPEARPETARFLEITRRLPMELQHIVSLAAVGSAADFIPLSVSEVGFQELAKAL
jgi:hypothetical protein